MDAGVGSDDAGNAERHRFDATEEVPRTVDIENVLRHGDRARSRAPELEISSAVTTVTIPGDSRVVKLPFEATFTSRFIRSSMSMLKYESDSSAPNARFIGIRTVRMATRKFFESMHKIYYLADHCQQA